MMIIYEVNLTIDSVIYVEFLSWLKEHVYEMLQFPGFIQASLLKQDDDKVNEQEKLTVQYQVKSRKELDHYFTEHSAKMREEGIKRFKGQFSATRRIFEIEDVISNNSE